MNLDRLTHLLDTRPPATDLDAEIEQLWDDQGPKRTQQFVRALILADPGWQAPQKLAGSIAAGQSRWGDAARHFHRAALTKPNTPAEPDSPALILQAAHSYFMDRNYEAALRCCDLNLARAGESAEALFLLGRSRILLGDAKAGQALINRAAEINADYRFASRVMRMALTTDDFDRVLAREGLGPRF